MIERLFKIIFLVIFFLLIVSMIVVLNTPKTASIKTQDGKTFPDTTNLRQLNGELVNPLEFTEGKILVNIWASWCITCLVEHPFLEKISQEYPDLKLVGINYKDTISKANNYLDRNGDPFVYSIFDNTGSFALKLGVTGAPETFLIIDGVIVEHRIGEVNRVIWEQDFEVFF